MPAETGDPRQRSCPSCGATDLGWHCPHPECRWLVCRRCGAFGEPGLRWAEKLR
jgi:hypothetical protein